MPNPAESDWPVSRLINAVLDLQTKVSKLEGERAVTMQKALVQSYISGPYCSVIYPNGATRPAVAFMFGYTPSAGGTVWVFDSPEGSIVIPRSA